jgi:ribose transport system permease protein
VIAKAVRTEVLWRGVPLAGLFIFFTVTVDGFASVNDVFSILEGFALMGLLSLGLGLTIISGEFDLSVAAVAAVAGLLGIKLIHLGWLPCLAAVGAASLLFGALQAVIFLWAGVRSIVFTLGTSIAVGGLAFIVSGSQTLALQSSEFSYSDAVTQQWTVFSPFSLVTLCAFVALGFALRLTRWGRSVRALGAARAEARAAGVRVTATIASCFALSALLAALAGLLASISGGSAAPGGFDPLLLPAATAALIGGVAISGGRGSALGIGIGVMTLEVLDSGLSLEGAQSYVQSLATGALLLFLVATEVVGPRVRRIWLGRVARTEGAVSLQR